MAKSKVYERGQADVSFNMTPMIDCTFQLILFFMLATQMASEDYVQMKVPKPDESIAKSYEEDGVIVNVVPYSDKVIESNASRDGLADYYKLGMQKFKLEDFEQLHRELATTKTNIADLEKRKAWVVEIRADANLEYAAVQPVLALLMRAKQEKIRITAMPKMMGE